ncbi:MAG: HAMP domain-containing histidine kinase [Gammaproteobacteria bacterium]|nr:HAMP domain-containing histidine kinase [Gammaproteobacteria bacterium]
MRSLRVQLLAWLIALYAASAAVTIFFNYRQYDSNINGFWDGQMRTLAVSYAGRLSAGESLPPFLRVDEYAVQHHGSDIVQFWSAGGKLRGTSLPVPGLELQPGKGFRTVRIGDHRWRVFTLDSTPLRVQIVESGDIRQRVVWDMTWDSAKPIVYLAPISIAMLWLVVYAALRPMTQLVRALSEQDERNLAELSSRRVPRELLPLIHSMNGLLRRMRSAFDSQRRFVADAAHELRTPITAVKLQIENLRGRVDRGAAEELQELEAGVERMHRVVRQLLQLARQEGAPEEGCAQSVDVGAVAEDSVRSFVSLAETRAVDLGMGEVQAVTARLDADQLRIVLDNLVDNAVRYTPPGGRVDVSVREAEGAVVIDVSDTGPGISPDDLEKVFSRFYRVRETGVEGSGLGLAIARAAAERCRSSIELCNRPASGGLTARVRIRPAA